MSNRLIVKQDIDTGEIGFGKINENDLVEGIKDGHATFIQAVPAKEWYAYHGLKKIPSGTAYDEQGNRIEGAETPIDTNTTLYTFNNLVSGKVEFN